MVKCHSHPEKQGGFLCVKKKKNEGEQQSPSAVVLPEEQHPKMEERREPTGLLSLILGVRVKVREQKGSTPMCTPSILQSCSLCKRHWEVPGLECQQPPTESLQGSGVCPGRVGNDPWKAIGSSCGLYLE